MVLSLMEDEADDDDLLSCMTQPRVKRLSHFSFVCMHRQSRLFIRDFLDVYSPKSPCYLLI